MAAAADNAARLTKKQRKAQAFRDKKGKGKGPKGRERPEPLDVPEQDDPDAENEENDEDKHPSAQPQQPAQKKKTGAGQASTDGLSKKRKHSDDAADAPAPKVKKRRKSIADEGQKDQNENEHELVEEETDASKPKKDSERQKRYILFVGNLKYTTTKEAILKHFSICDPPPTVRLLAPKSTKTATGAARSKSKGCAFLEFATRPALQSALALHGSTLDSRQINVELTAGGGGKGAGRLEKLKARNRGLAEQRTKSLMKQAAGRDGKARAKAGATNPDGVAPLLLQPDRPQRHSTTSGVDVIPLKPRTWSVPEDGDDASSNPRKKRGSKSKGGGKPRNHGTGVNAIPVG